VGDERLAETLERLERERAQADRRYNDALTGVDRAIRQPGTLPGSPAPYDDSQLGALNDSWDIVPEGPALGGFVKGRLRRLVWNLAGPVFGAQKRFNATLVDHLNRNVRSHQEAQLAAEAAAGTLRQHTAEVLQFQTKLIQFLQTITLYVDTKDRAVLGHCQVLNAGLSEIADANLKRWTSLTAREERFMSRVAAIDDVRATAALAQQTALTLKREVERLLAAGAPATPGATAPDAGAARADLDAFKYVGFEDSFRGSAEDITARLRDYLPRFDGLGDVVDLGCGRGEFLSLLRERGIPSRGVDLNHEMVEAARARGLDVDETDALTFLERQADASLGGVFAAQVVEHLDPAYLARLLETAFHKLRPGGRLIFETINVACWSAFFESYLRDLTHVKALHPDTLQFLLRASGFQQVEIELRAPVPATARLQPAPSPANLSPELADLVETFNDNVAKLNGRMFTFQDYAVIGRK
jgi:predicted TPR repeat methyltransferase